MTSTDVREPAAARPQRLFLGAFAGLAAAIIGAIAWAAVTVTTNYQIGYMAIGVGLLVGWAVRLGNGGKPFAFLGAFLALLGCVLGNLFSMVAYEATQQNISVFTVLGNIDYAVAASALWEDFFSMSILFYGIAVYEGYKFSVVRDKTTAATEPVRP